MTFLWVLTVVTLSLSGIDGSIDIIPSSETCTKWQPVSECTVTCGGGTKDVTRSCTAKVKCNEQACPPPCTAGIDIAILLDISRSIDFPEREDARDFVKRLVAEFDPGNDGDHFGLITFRTDVKVVFKFSDSQYYDKNALKTKISSVPIVPSDPGWIPDPEPGHTRTDVALKKARDELFTVAGGDRADKPNVMFVLSDGKPNPKKKFGNIKEQLAKDFKAKKVLTIAVGVGSRIDSDTLQEIAGEGNPVFHVDNFSQLKNKLDDIKKAICPARF